jgi:hypothetical protein
MSSIKTLVLDQRRLDARRKSMPRSWSSAFLVAVGLVSFGCQSRDATPTDWKSHLLGKGQVTVRAPADFQQSMEPEETLALTPSNDSGVTLRFNLHYLEGQGVPADVGAQFVRDQAMKKNLPVTEQGGKVIMTETNTAEEKGVKVERRFWQIGFQNAVVVMSATIVASKKDTAVVKECLEKTVPVVIESLKKR